MKHYRYFLEDKHGNVIPVGVANNGNAFYIIDKVQVQRGIKGKTRSKVDELLVVGMNFKQMEKYCKKNKLNLCRKLIDFE